MFKTKETDGKLGVFFFSLEQRANRDLSLSIVLYSIAFKYIKHINTNITTILKKQRTRRDILLLKTRRHSARES